MSKMAKTMPLYFMLILSIAVKQSQIIDILKRHGQFVAFDFYCKIMLISISYNYCSVLTANKCFIETTDFVMLNVECL